MAEGQGKGKGKGRANYTCKSCGTQGTKKTCTYCKGYGISHPTKTNRTCKGCLVRVPVGTWLEPDVRLCGTCCVIAEETPYV
jgi:hypothetical protein